MAESFKSIQDAIVLFDRKSIQEHIQAGEKERQEILQRFPIFDWPAMPLEKYALGLPQSADSFCRWLEFNSPHLGSMRGGSAGKHIIYKHKNQPGWYYYYQSMKDENEAWDAVRGDFVKAFQAANEGRWDDIDALPYLHGANALKLKTLFVYFPKEILSISSVYHIRHFLERLGVWKDEMSQWEPIKLNRFLLGSLQAIPELLNWSTSELERLLYFWADPRESRRILKIAPGEDAKYWDDCIANGYICVGWDDVGDLREFDSKDAFMAKFSEVFSSEYKNNMSTTTRKAKELWSLIELEPGDIIVANKGMSKVLAIGEVVDPGYIWDPERTIFKHTVSVKWDTSFAQDVPPQQNWVFTTIGKISISFYQQLVSGIKSATKKIDIPLDPIFEQLERALDRKGQVILYGPPGTGKTYQAQRFATWWLTKHNSPRQVHTAYLNSDKLKAEIKKWSTGNAAPRVWWLVANPKEWTWDTLFKNKKESFRYGRLQRNYPLVQPGDLVIGYQARPDKKIAALARITKGLNELMGDTPHLEIEPVLEIPDGPTYEEMLNDEVLKNSEPIHNHCQGTLFALTSEEAPYLFDLISEKLPAIDKYVTSGEGIGYLTWLTFHPSYSYEDFIEGFRPVESSDGLMLKMSDGIFKRICREALLHPKQNYLVIIDEINRANLAKVFGEIITLLEKDKRGIPITLPQSKEMFTIPNNVYVIGTMNTADRSIKLLDVALRRRFSFLELMPDPELLEGVSIGGLELNALLSKLNQRIIREEGREKQLGHALLMDNNGPIRNPEELADRFRQDILPLLQEYCYEDYAELEKILGNELVDADENCLLSEAIEDDEKLILALINLTSSQD
ncbi:MAG: hypothetical protein CVU42_00190 [Chloroflexi bacterium HGW-Chloroflexi-4]|jgi:5-methylcytosine-specific restriction protein B|nr:MAG: hypothetical protein CVU42_00190 [Chloroflexi bacterium HGW-Chloroflexi-4]